MSRSLTQLTIFASGTAETEFEKAALRRVAEELNKVLEKTHAITLRVRAWPDDIRPGVNSDPQSELSRQIGVDYDIYVGLLGSHFGTPTQHAGSGTEEEFETALARFQTDSRTVRLLFYFKRAVEDPFSMDLDQLQRVKRFRSGLSSRGVLYRDFTDTPDFVQQVKDHLFSLIADDWKGQQWAPVDRPPDHPRNGERFANQPSGPVDSPPNTGDPPVTEPSPPASPDALTEPLLDDSDLGLLEYLDGFNQSTEFLVSALEQMTGHTKAMNERITQRTAELETIRQEYERVQHVGGSRAQQEYVSKMKKLVDGAGDDLDEYARSVSSSIDHYRIHSRATLSQFRAAAESAGDLWNEGTKAANREALLKLASAMQTSLQQTTDFQATIRRTPALTGKFKRARNRAAEILGEFIAEMTFSITELQSLAAWLGAPAND